MMVSRRLRGALAVPLLVVAVAGLPAKTMAQATPELDVPFVPTPQEVVAAMLRMAETGPNDIVYDLGSGDGRIVVTAIRDFKARKGVGVDLDPARVRDGNQNALKAGVGDRASFFEGDVFKFDFSEATVLTMYLYPSVNMQLRPRILAELKPGTRVVSHQFGMQDWVPDAYDQFDDNHSLYMWFVPAKVDGTWVWEIGGDRYQLELKQHLNKVSGVFWLNGRTALIEKPLLKGDRFSFGTAIGTTEVRFNGKVLADAIEADLDVGGITRIVAKPVR